MPRRRILILEPPGGELSPLRDALGAALGGRGRLETVTGAGEIEQRLAARNPPDLLLLDYGLGDGVTTGATLVRALRALGPELLIVAVAEIGTVELAAEAIGAGATDFMVRAGQIPERVATLMARVTRLCDLRDDNRQLAEQNRTLTERERERYRIVGSSAQIRQVLDKVERVAAIPRPVLVVGERGTGKELVARAIHAASGRASSPFVVVNCAAFPDTLLESELFGHERGAFTGADRRVRGRFDLADGGILFLDEIGHMSPSFQRKILRVVEYGTFTPVGGCREIKTDARLVAATNADLHEMIRSGRFLQDLYDRLAFEVVEVPPLRDRAGDVALLAQHFLDGFMREVPTLGGKRLAPAAIAVLERYPFPGNVRELKIVIERSAYRDTTREITPEDLGTLAQAVAAAEPDNGGFDDRVAAFKRKLVRDALARAGGNQAKAAPLLGLSYHQFRYYLRKYSRD